MKPVCVLLAFGFLHALSAQVVAPASPKSGAQKAAPKPASASPARKAAAPKGPAVTAAQAAELARQALAAREAGKLDESVLLYKRALAARPNDPESWWYQGLNFYDLDRYQEGEEAFARLTSLDEKNGGAWALRGLCAFQNGKHKDAFAFIVLGKKNGIPAGSELDRVSHYHYLLLTVKLGQFELATALLSSVSNTVPDMPALTEMSGLSALRMPLLPREIPADKQEPVTLAGRAAFLAWVKRLPEAEKTVRGLIEKYPRLPNAHYLLGYILLLQHSEQTIDAFRKELEISPNHVQARLQIAYEYLKRGKGAGGMSFAREAVKLSPGDFAARNIYGRILLDQNRVADAIPELEQAVKLAPTSAEAHFSLSTAYARAGRKEESEKHRKAFVLLRKELENAPPDVFPNSQR